MTAETPQDWPPPASEPERDIGRLLTPTPGTGSGEPSAWLRRGLLAATGVVALVIGLVQIDRPAPWADEGVTVLVVRRSWQGILALGGGADAPMILYYLLAKAWSSALWWLPTVTAVRTLSAVAAALAVVCLAAIVARLSGLAPAVLAGLLLAGLPGFTRYAQEARPYALLVLATTAGWLAWLAWPRPEAEPGRSWWRTGLRTAGSGWPYVLTLALAPLVHLFGLLQWPAQVLADLTTPGLTIRSRWRRALTTVGVMVGVLVVVGVPVAVAALRGTGPTSLRSLSRLLNVFSQTMTGFIQFPPAIPFLVLVGLGLLSAVVPSRVTTPHRGLVRICALWFVVPLLLGIGLAAVKPAMFRARYWQPLLPPLAALAAIGLVVVVHGSYVLIRSRGTVPAWRATVAAAVAAVVGLAGVGIFVHTVAPQHVRLRQPGGHRIKLAPALARVDALLAEDPGLPVLVSPRSRSVIFIATRPELTASNPLIRVEDLAVTVWPPQEPAAAVAARLEGHDRAIWVLADQGPTKRPVDAPKILAGTGFELVEVKRAGTWWVSVLER